MPQQSDSYDYIVVGAGTAGSVVAARLTEDPGVRVLLIEAGAPNTTSTSDFPPAWPALLQSAQNWGGEMTVQAATGTSPHIGRGKGIGGSSAINAMVFARGHRESYADWPERGAKGWAFDDLLPFFKRSETAVGRDATLRGQDGPLVVGPASSLHEIPAAMLRAAVECGHPSADDISGGNEIGFGAVDLNIVNGRRQSAANAYLTDGPGRPNLRLESNALVHRVTFDGDRVTGVEYGIGPSTVTANAREVILCAGAIGTPQLLMLSGIGPAQHLRDHGIAVLHDRPGVGSNLQDHPMTAAIWASARMVSPSTRNHGEVIGLIRSELAQSDAPDIQLMFAENLAGAQPEVPNVFGLSVSGMQPHSRGTVRLADANPASLPLVDPNFLGDERDLEVLVRGLRIGHQIGSASALDEWRGPEIIPGPAFSSDDALRAYVRASVGSHYHPIGTCAIGDTVDSVVGTDLTVHGIDGLRVVDASVMPSLPSNNTVATVYAIAERGAHLLRQQ